MRILAVANPKGGVAKTTTAVTLATIAAEAGKKTLVVDADENHSATRIISRYGDRVDLDYASEDDTRNLSRLRQLSRFDLVVVDLPGARKGGELRAILTGRGDRPAVDAVLMPTEGDAMDLPVLQHAITHEVTPAGVPYAVVLVRVEPHPAAIAGYQAQAEAMRKEHGIHVFDSLVRRYSAHKEAQWEGVPLIQYGGRHSRARRAEDDYRAVAAETWALLGLKWRTDRPQEGSD